MDIFFISKLIGALGAILTALYACYKGTVKVYKGGRKVTEQWNRMVAELTPNGGSSIKDAIGRIETRQLIEVQVRKALNNDAIYGIWESDSEGRSTYANRTYQRIVGRNFEDLEGWGWVSAVHPDDRKRITDEWKLSIEQKREFSNEFRVLRPDGNEVQVISVGHPLKDRDGNLKGYVGQLVTLAAEDHVFFSYGD